MVRRRIMRVLKINEISLVDLPMQTPARVAILKRMQFEKLKPGKGESENDYVSRFMGDPKMREEYPDEKQRAAVAHSMFRQVHKELPEGAAPADSLNKGTDSAGSTAGAAGPTEKDIMTPEEKAAFEKAAKEQLDAVTKRAERAERLAELNDAERAYLKALGAPDQDRFLALGSAERQAELVKVAAANPVVETIDGVEYRKLDDPRLLKTAQLLKQERDLRLASEKQNREADLRKRAEELEFLPGEVKDRVALLAAIDTMEAAPKAAALNILKVADEALSGVFEAHGTRGDTDNDSPEAKLDALAKGIRTANPKLTKEQAYAKALETPEGQALYEEVF